MTVHDIYTEATRRGLRLESAGDTSASASPLLSESVFRLPKGPQRFSPSVLRLILRPLSHREADFITHSAITSTAARSAAMVAASRSLPVRGVLSLLDNSGTLSRKPRTALPLTA